jgi:hypothetical protein
MHRKRESSCSWYEKKRREQLGERWDEEEVIWWGLLEWKEEPPVASLSAYAPQVAPSSIHALP